MSLPPHDDRWRARCGFLTTAERREVERAIRSGRTYLEIAIDWLVSEARVCQIAKEIGAARRKLRA
jgi:hypothetical protein